MAWDLSSIRAFQPSKFNDWAVTEVKALGYRRNLAGGDLPACMRSSADASMTSLLVAVNGIARARVLLWLVVLASNPHTRVTRMSAPALDEDHSGAQHENANEGRNVTPLPWGQLLIALLVQLAEPITGVVIFPFINQFVRETGITGGDETRTGYFAGIIVRT
jgi:hypothetical protein